MIEGTTTLTCGGCGTVHTPSKPPTWDYTDADVIRVVCVECDDVVIEAERERPD